jgi:hypothetical protein
MALTLDLARCWVANVPSIASTEGIRLWQAIRTHVANQPNEVSAASVWVEMWVET